MSSDARVDLTEDETVEAELIADTLADSPVARDQVAAELVLLRKLYAASRRDRHRLPINARRVIDRFPPYSRRIEFRLACTHYLELEP